MDPVTAGLQLANTIGLIVLEAMKGQTPQQKEAIWNWYVEDVKWWRKWLKLDTPSA